VVREHRQGQPSQRLEDSVWGEHIPVERILVRVVLWHLGWRQVYRHRFGRQKSNSVRSDILSCSMPLNFRRCNDGGVMYIENFILDCVFTFTTSTEGTDRSFDGFSVPVFWDVPPFAVPLVLCLCCSESANGLCEQNNIVMWINTLLVVSF